MSDLENFLDSLQQEQPSEKTCKKCGFYENNCPYIRGKFIPYPSKVCKDYTYSVIKEQEQPSEDLRQMVNHIWKCRGKGDPSQLVLFSYDEVCSLMRTGAEWQKEQMLKDAVEGYVNYYEDGGGKLMAEAQVGCPYHIGDKVKIVIVKED